MKSFWPAMVAAALALAPAGIAAAQDKAAGGPQQTQTADEDGDGGATAAVDTSVQDKALKAAAAMKMMPANALSGDQLGLPPVGLTSQNVPPLVLGQKGNDFAVSRNDFILRVGQSYHWDITSAGGLEYKFEAPDFFRNIWIDEIVVDDLEVHMAGPPAWLEYDDKGTISLHFKAVEPGRFDWHVGEAKGGKSMGGTILVVR